MRGELSVEQMDLRVFLTAEALDRRSAATLACVSSCAAGRSWATRRWWRWKLG